MILFKTPHVQLCMSWRYLFRWPYFHTGEVWGRDPDTLKDVTSRIRVRQFLCFYYWSIYPGI